jgi:hypothetical protein
VRPGDGRVAPPIASIDADPGCSAMSGEIIFGIPKTHSVAFRSSADDAAEAPRTGPRIFIADLVLMRTAGTICAKTAVKKLFFDGVQFCSNNCMDVWTSMRRFINFRHGPVTVRFSRIAGRRAGLIPWLKSIDS